MNPALLSVLPPPPPWRRETDVSTNEDIYINEVTGEKTDIHPLKKHFEEQKSDEENSLLTSNLLEKSDFCERKEDFCSGEHLDFRCEWKEIGLMGNILSYGITLKYYLEDKHFEISFDGVDALWKYSKIDGIYGPLDEFDLFIGSKVTIFGRHLSISSTNCDICRMIDNSEKKLKKQCAYLQDKIETIGAIPIVKRPLQDPIRNVTRSTSKTGHGNLRKLRNDVLKLSEQIASLGLTHMIK